MNNGKIRIYDLSKELNLENRDIINICESLNISVKSHSSTINESEVQQIRDAVKTYTKPTKRRPKAQKPPAPQRSDAKTNKPQLRRLVKNTNDEAPQRRDLPSTNSSSAQSITSQAPKLSTPPPRPGSERSRHAEETQNGHGAQAPTVTSPETIEVTPEATPPLPPPTAQPPRVAAVSAPATPPETETPELIEPPTRPQKPSAKRTNEASGKSGSPQRRPAGQPQPQSKGTTAVAKAPQPPTAGKTKSTKKDGQRQESRGTETREKAGKSTPPLTKSSAPQKPKPQLVELIAKPKVAPPEEAPPKVKAIEPDLDNEEQDQGTPLDEPELLKPPTRPQKPKRPVQRPQETRWVEDETPEKGKVAKGKVGTKGKRKSMLIDDEDDFDIDVETGQVSAASQSLSMARPPKPPTANKGSGVSSTPPAAKNRSKGSRQSREQRSESRQSAARAAKTPETPPEKVVLGGNLSMRELSNLVKMPETDIIRHLFTKGIAVNITQTLDLETATKVIEELGIQVETPEMGSAAIKSEMLDVEDLESLQARPPVVTIMGHVDHGKTTLLDSIRKTKVAQGEAGGITQHIGAYHVDVEHNGVMQQVVFLDTPGHEAFTAMRARGTKVTDIAILVVAADDGVQPQTKEAISHARAAEVPLIVAINKVDKPEAEPDRIKQELTEQGLVPEEWGGETIMVPVSAIHGENLDTLLEMILLVSELEELSANPERPAKGTVIEAHLDKARGPVATLLIQNGTLRVGDNLVAGSSFGKIRAMIDDRGNRVEAASPSFAVEVLGMNDVPAAGDEFDVYPSEKEARAIADARAVERRENRLQQAMSRRVTLSSLSAQAQEGELKELNLILKADVQGSVEAITAALERLPQNEVQIRILLAAPGEVTETDVDLAAASGAVIIGFNTDLAPGAAQAADHERVSIQEYNIIYNLLDDIQGAMEGLLDPEEVEEPLGTTEVRAVFPVGRGSVAGCYVQSGKVIRNRRMRVLRGEEVVFDGAVDSLKRIREDVREVNAGYECGIGSDKFNGWEVGDRIETYQMVMKRRTLSMK